MSESCSVNCRIVKLVAESESLCVQDDVIVFMQLSFCKPACGTAVCRGLIEIDIAGVPL